VTETKRAEHKLAEEKAALETEFAATADALGRTQEELRALTASLLRSQEEESRRVARELHDDISQKLAFLDMEMQQIAEEILKDQNGARTRLESLRQGIGRLSEEVRRISHRLHPSIVDDLGLPQALRALVEDFGEREGMLATFSSRTVPDEVPRQIAAGLYRIAQEALRNVAKHAGKTHVKVTLEGWDERLRMEVADLGQGFDPEGTRAGLGLTSMGERARLIGGKLNVGSALGKGTTVTIEAPLPKQE
jgi:two-component system CheB/CheR fusion protein